MPFDVAIDEWREKAARIGDAILVVAVSRRYHRIFVAGEGAAIVDYLRSVRVQSPEMLSESYWNDDREGCRLRAAHVVVPKSVSGRKRRRSYFPYFETRKMMKCVGSCQDARHACTTVSVPLGGRTVVVCECRDG